MSKRRQEQLERVSALRAERDNLKKRGATRYNSDLIAVRKELRSAEECLRVGRKRDGVKPVQKATVTPAAEKAPPAVPDLIEARAERKQSTELKRREKLLVDEVTRLRDAVDSYRAESVTPPEPIVIPPYGNGKREATAYAILSDLHIETLVKPTDTPTGNCFNLAIADYRLKRFFKAVKWSNEQHGAFNVRNLVLGIIGDLITNYLHPENVETAQLGPLAATFWIRDRLIAGIELLLTSDLERIDILCLDGNHGRTTKYMQTSATAHDHGLERVVYDSIAQRYANNPRVNVYAPESTHLYHKVYNYTLHMHHGHEVKYGGGVGGISIPLLKAVSQWDRARKADYTFIGHWHQYLDLGHVVVNGSLIGYDGYAHMVKATPELPQQAYGLIDSKRGKCWTTALWVGNPEVEKKLWNGDRFAHSKGKL